MKNKRPLVNLFEIRPIKSARDPKFLVILIGNFFVIVYMLLLCKNEKNSL